MYKKIDTYIFFCEVQYNSSTMNSLAKRRIFCTFILKNVKTFSLFLITIVLWKDRLSTIVIIISIATGAKASSVWRQLQIRRNRPRLKTAVDDLFAVTRVRFSLLLRFMPVGYISCMRRGRAFANPRDGRGWNFLLATSYPASSALGIPIPGVLVLRLTTSRDLRFNLSIWNRRVQLQEPGALSKNRCHRIAENYLKRIIMFYRYFTQILCFRN